MAIFAELPDGTRLEFPEGTAEDVIQRTVKRQLGITEDTATTAEPSALDQFVGAAKELNKFSPLGGLNAAADELVNGEGGFGDRALRAARGLADRMPTPFSVATETVKKGVNQQLAKNVGRSEEGKTKKLRDKAMAADEASGLLAMATGDVVRGREVRNLADSSGSVFSDKAYEYEPGMASSLNPDKADFLSKNKQLWLNAEASGRISPEFNSLPKAEQAKIKSTAIEAGLTPEEFQLQDIADKSAKLGSFHRDFLSALTGVEATAMGGLFGLANAADAVGVPGADRVAAGAADAAMYFTAAKEARKSPQAKANLEQFMSASLSDQLDIAAHKIVASADQTVLAVATRGNMGYLAAMSAPESISAMEKAKDAGLSDEKAGQYGLGYLAANTLSERLPFEAAGYLGKWYRGLPLEARMGLAGRIRTLTAGVGIGAAAVGTESLEEGFAVGLTNQLDNLFLGTDKKWNEGMAEAMYEGAMAAAPFGALGYSEVNAARQLDDDSKKLNDFIQGKPNVLVPGLLQKGGLANYATEDLSLVKARADAINAQRPGAVDIAPVVAELDRRSNEILSPGTVQAQTPEQLSAATDAAIAAAETQVDNGKATTTETDIAALTRSSVTGPVNVSWNIGDTQFSDSHDYQFRSDGALERTITSPDGTFTEVLDETGIWADTTVRPKRFADMTEATRAAQADIAAVMPASVTPGDAPVQDSGVSTSREQDVSMNTPAVDTSVGSVVQADTSTGTIYSASGKPYASQNNAAKRIAAEGWGQTHQAVQVEGGWAIAPMQAAATQTENAPTQSGNELEAVRDQQIAAINATLERAGGTVRMTAQHMTVSDIDTNDAAFAAAAKFAADNGQRLLVVDYSEDAPMKPDGWIDGNGNIFVDRNSQDPVGVVVTHEATHALEGTAYYEAVKQAVLENTSWQAKLGFQFAYTQQEEAQGRGTPDDATLSKEFVANIVQNLGADPAFWQEVYKKADAIKKGEAKGMLDKLVQSLNKAIKKLKALKMTAEQKRIEKIRNTAMEAFARHMAEVKGEVAPAAAEEMLPESESGVLPWHIEEFGEYPNNTSVYVKRGGSVNVEGPKGFYKNLPGFFEDTGKLSKKEAKAIAKRAYEATKAEIPLQKTGVFPDHELFKDFAVREYEVEGGVLKIAASYAVKPSAYKRIYGEPGGIINFRLSGPGILGTDGITGLTYHGDLTEQLLKDLAIAVYESKQKDPRNAGKKKKPAKVIASGMSSTGNLKAGLEEGIPVGVDVNLLSDNGIEEAAQLLAKNGGTMFIDSGAFSLFTAQLRGAEGGRYAKDGKMDFDKVIARYDELIGATMMAVDDIGREDSEDPEGITFYPVMPDVVGDSAKSLEELSKFSRWMRFYEWMKSVHPIIPIQKVNGSLVGAFDAIASTLEQDGVDVYNFVLGIPSNEAAVSVAELEEFLKARGDQVGAIHFLGTASEKVLLPRMEAVKRYARDAEVTADAALIRKVAKKGMTKDEKIAKVKDQSGDIEFSQKIKDTPYPMGDIGVQFSVKAFTPGKDAYDPRTNLPLNKNGTVNVYMSTTALEAREIKRNKRIDPKGRSELVFTNDSDLLNREAGDTGMVQVVVPPEILQISRELGEDPVTGMMRYEYRVPLTGGAFYAKKMNLWAMLHEADNPIVNKAMLEEFKRLAVEQGVDDPLITDMVKLDDVAAMINKGLDDYLALSDKERKLRKAEAKKILKYQHNVTGFLGENGKLEKTRENDGLDLKMATLGLPLASAQQITDKWNTCPNHKSCKGVCLADKSGQNALYGGVGSWRKAVRLAQFLKTEAIIVHPAESAIMIYEEIKAFKRWADKNGYGTSVRLNVNSDYNPRMWKSLIEALPDVSFYDYTKLDSKPIAPNHHLTYSSTGVAQTLPDGTRVDNPYQNWNRMRRQLDNGYNVAMAFTDKNQLPSFVLDQETGKRYKVVNGDTYDYRPLDATPEGEDGVIIGLANKDNSLKRAGITPAMVAEAGKGFFVYFDPAVHTDGVVTIEPQGRGTIPINSVSFSQKSGTIPLGKQVGEQDGQTDATPARSYEELRADPRGDSGVWEDAIARVARFGFEREGALRTFYHAGADGGAVLADKTGQPVRSPSSRWGGWLTVDQGYSATFGTPHPYYAALENPYVTSLDKLAALPDNKYDNLRQDLLAKGHDGIYLKGVMGAGDQVVIFYPDRAVPKDIFDKSFDDNAIQFSQKLKDLGLERDKQFGVGKNMGGTVYLHRQYEDVLPQEELAYAKDKLEQEQPDFEYNAVRYDRKTGEIAFQESPDFDTRDEPTVGRTFAVKADGSTKMTNPPADPLIWHHKWQWVKDDYEGFDVEAAKQRSIDWKTKLGTDKAVSSRIGRRSFWDQWTAENGVQESVQFSQKIKGQEGSSTTQVATTVGSYRKAAAALSKYLPEGGRVLDYGAGLGLGTDAMREELPNASVDSYEPFPQRWKGKQAPTFTKSEAIPQEYDGIVNLNVLNVLEPDIRDAVAMDIMSKLAPGGTAIIGTRKWTGDVNGAKNFEPADEEKAIWILRGDQRVYQKGFDGDELRAYLQSLAPAGVSVSRGNGIAANTAIIRKDGVQFSQKKPFYSQLERALEAQPDRMLTGPGKQVAQWLQSNAPKLGIKKDEIQWTGVTDWLETQKKVTKQDVLDYLAGNGVRVEEVMLGESGLNDPGEMYIEEVSDGEWGVFAEDGNQIGGSFTEYRDADAYLNELAKDTPTRYGQWVLHGGENYRELLLTLPEKKGSLPKGYGVEQVQYQDGTIKYFAYTPTTRSAAYKTEQEAKEELNRSVLSLKDFRDRTQGFRSSHWEQPNILAHIRFNERTDAEGNRVLFIEEIQSDWGQKGKKEGFKSDQNIVGYKFDEDKQDWVQVQDTEATSWGLDKVNDDPLSSNLYGSRAEAEKTLNYRVGVPSAPFVTDTKSWTALAVKRMIAYAVDNGFDKIAFVNGQQSADRYENALLEVVDSIEHRKLENGEYAVTSYKNGSWVQAATGDYSEAKLELTFGKEIADRIVRGEGKDLTDDDGRAIKELSGLQLKVGGEGMKAFYDQIVPQVTNDVLKKLGSAERVGEVQFNDFAEKRADMIRRGMPSLSQEEASKYAGTQPGFTISPDLKAKVASEGLVLFSQKADEELRQKMAAAIAQGNDAVKSYSEQALEAAQSDWEELKRFIVKHGDTEDMAEKLAERLGWSVDEVSKLLEEAGKRNIPAATAIGTALVTTRVNIARMLDAKSEGDMFEAMKDTLNLMVATRAHVSEVARALSYVGWAERKGGWSQALAGSEKVNTAVREATGKLNPEPKGEEKVLVGKFNDAQRETADAQYKVDEAVESQRQLEEEVAQAEIKMADAREQANKQRAEVRKLEAQLRQLDKKTAGYAQKAKDLQTRINQLNAQLKLSEKGMLEAQAKVAGLRQQIKEAKKQIEKNMRRLTTAVKVQDTLDKKLAVLSKKARSSLISKSELLMAMGGPEGVRRLFAVMREQGKRSQQNQQLINMFLQGIAKSMVEQKKLDQEGLYRKFIRGLLEQWRAMILTGMFTHFVNLASTAANLSLNKLFVETVAAALPGGMGARKHIATLFGLQSVAADIWANMKFAALDESQVKQLEHLLKSNPDQQRMMLEIAGHKWMDDSGKALPGTYGKVIRSIGFTPLGMEDAVFKTLSYKYELAKQQAMGLPEDHHAAIMAAKADVFQADVTGLAGLVSQATHKAPELGFLIPFVKTLVNITNRSLQLFPLTGAIIYTVNGTLGGKYGVDARNRAIGTLIAGAALSAIAIMLGGDDDDDETRLDGMPPAEWRARQQWLETRAPLGLRIGEQHYNMSRFDPLSTVMGLALTSYKAFKALANEDGLSDQELSRVLGGAAQNILWNLFLGKSWMSGTAQFFDDIMQGNIAALARFPRDILISAAIPNALPQGMDFFEQDRYRTYRNRNLLDLEGQVREAKEAVMYKIPGLRQQLEPRLNNMGEVARSNRYQTMIERTTPANKELNRWMDSIGKYVVSDVKSLDGFPLEVKQELLQERKMLLEDAKLNSEGLTREEQRTEVESALRKWGRLVSDRRELEGLPTKKSQREELIEMQRGAK